MKKILWLPFLLLAFAFASCSETDEDANEYSNWKARNTAYFNSIMAKAHDSIAWAQKEYGDAWQEKGNWRTYLSYSLQTDTAHTTADSICVQIVRRGMGTQHPLGTDSVRINYRTQLMPTNEHPQGLVVDHSGLFSSYESVFNLNTASPSTFKMSGLCRGVATALLYMVPGDLWRVYVPSRLAYGSTKSGKIPAHSCVIFEIYLVDTWPLGTIPTTWH